LQRDFSIKLGWENVAKGNLSQISNGNGIRIVNSIISKIVIAKGTTFPERDLYKHNSTSPDGMTYKTEHIFLMKGDIQA